MKPKTYSNDAILTNDKYFKVNRHRIYPTLSPDSVFLQNDFPFFNKDDDIVLPKAPPTAKSERHPQILFETSFALKKTKDPEVQQDGAFGSVKSKGTAGGEIPGRPKRSKSQIRRDRSLKDKTDLSWQASEYSFDLGDPDFEISLGSYMDPDSVDFGVEIPRDQVWAEAQPKTRLYSTGRTNQFEKHRNRKNVSEQRKMKKRFKRRKWLPVFWRNRKEAMLKQREEGLNNSRNSKTLDNIDMSSLNPNKELAPRGGPPPQLQFLPTNDKMGFLNTPTEMEIRSQFGVKSQNRLDHFCRHSRRLNTVLCWWRR